MAWTDPRTWGASDTPTAAQFNTDIRDNMSYLFDAIHNPYGFPQTLVDPRRYALDRGVSVANRCRYFRTIGTGQIGSVGVHVAVSSGVIGVAVYDNSGEGQNAVPITRLATSGTVACPAGGFAAVSIAGTVTMGTTGQHWFALSANNTSATFHTGATSIGAEWTPIGVAWSEEAAHPPPGTPLAGSVGVSAPMQISMIGI